MTTFTDRTDYPNDGWTMADVGVVHAHLKSVAALPDVKTILEIGSGDGSGSTTAIVSGMAQNPGSPKLWAMETHHKNFSALCGRFAKNNRVACLRAASVPVGKYLAKEIILQESPVGIWNLAQAWEREQRELADYPAECNGIELAKKMAGVSTFDFVYIDASPFSADEELNQVWGARYIALDDVNDIKNRRNHQRLCASHEYQEVVREYKCNVWSLFERVK